jgi:hypothetical protein
MRRKGKGRKLGAILVPTSFSEIIEVSHLGETHGIKMTLEHLKDFHDVFERPAGILLTRSEGSESPFKPGAKPGFLRAYHAFPLSFRNQESNSMNSWKKA